MNLQVPEKYNVRISLSRQILRGKLHKEPRFGVAGGNYRWIAPEFITG
jgi:hypothetical protein